MKSTILFTILLLSFPFSYSQNIVTDSSAPVVAYWNKGEKKELTITKLATKTQGKNVTSNKVTYRAIIKVLDSTAEGYTMEWIYKYDFKKGMNLMGLEDLFNDLRVVYTTTDVGAFKQLVNFDEMKLFMEKTVKVLGQSAKDTAGMDMIMNQVKQIFSSRESIEQLLLREISLYHTPYGLEYTFTKVEQGTELPNFLGGDPWPGIISVGLLQLNPKQNNARIFMDMELDKSKAAQNMKEYLKKLASSAGKQVPDEELSFLIEIKDHSEFDVMLDSGWLKRAYVKRIVKAGDFKKEETTSVEIK